MLFEYKITPSITFELLYASKIVSFEENFAFCPVKGSTTIIVIPSATLKGLASDFLIAFLIKFLNTGRAVFDPVSNLPKGWGLSLKKMVFI